MIDALREPGPEQKLEYEQDVGGDREQIGFECAEAKRSYVEREIVCWGSLRVCLAIEFQPREPVTHVGNRPAQANQIGRPHVPVEKAFFQHTQTQGFAVVHVAL